ncbi:cytochrome P450 [Streptomyces sp. B1866]|uniref:cytochrome P450 n=1 Tax=Streptomyces sp. B1866 TaxID=3075431 RepID=UPI00288FE0BC|nr:cytochrome P450 [Streptomyces sp. B1866]MDT3399127.1 cytochrome P450 [Streptomyces sp. B1866]
MTTTADTEAVRLPSGSRLPRALQGVSFIVDRRRAIRRLRRRHGSAFTVNVPLFGHCVVVSEPTLLKQLFMAGTDLANGSQPELAEVLGHGSLFGMDGDEHRRNRKLLVPPFHGKRMKEYEAIIEEETLREMASWPEGEEFPTLEPMMRITLNAILRAVFGAEGAEFQALREELPPFVLLGSRLAVLPIPQWKLGPLSPWSRFRARRRRIDVHIDSLIDRALADPALEERADVLALLLRARYEDGSGMSRQQISDQLLTLLAAGHETTATTLGWAVERLRRHPALLRRLVAEADAGGSELRQATVYEVQRTRPVVDLTSRRVVAPTMALGEWVIPQGYAVLASIDLTHEDGGLFPNAAAFDPDRFVGAHPDTYSWIPFGGGARRCIGAAFANMEMNVVLRTLLREFDLAPTAEPDERWHSRGVTFAPGRGGRALVRRRRDAAAGSTTAAVAAMSA